MGWVLRAWSHTLQFYSVIGSVNLLSTNYKPGSVLALGVVEGGEVGWWDGGWRKDE